MTTLAAQFIEKPSLTDPGFPLKVYITNIHHTKKTMVRTQIYLTEHEQSALRQLSRQFKQSQSELIRQAIDRFINDGIAPPFYRHLLDYGQIPSPLKTPKDTLYIHERPGQIIVLSRGAVSVQWANRELKKYQKNLRQGLIKGLVHLH